jgi:hypothetical protein
MQVFENFFRKSAETVEDATAEKQYNVKARSNLNKCFQNRRSVSRHLFGVKGTDKTEKKPLHEASLQPATATTAKTRPLR